MNNERQQLAQHVRKQLTGYKLLLDGDKLIGENPLECFVTGLLFPVSEVENSIEEVFDTDSDNESDSVLEVATPKLKRYRPPSSVGFSFFISGDAIILRVFYDAIHYQKDDKENRNPDGTFKPNTWDRIELTDDGGEEVKFTPTGQKQYFVLKEKARIEALWRPHGEGYIVTVTLLNAQPLSNTDSSKSFIEENNKTLFNVALSCIIDSGALNVYPSKNKALLSDEEQEIELRYKDKHIYAVGHGAAADWKTNSEGKQEVFADFMPMVEVPQVTANTSKGSSRTLNFSFLSNSASDLVTHDLDIFIQGYGEWIMQQAQQSNDEDLDDQNTAKKIINKQKIALERMKQGVHKLSEDPDIYQAFSTMNKAMLMQWKVGKPDAQDDDFSWRPFQLAFILMTLESSINNDNEYRDTVDLIWFPTGGGKTEAYLGLMAFLFLYRRLKYPASAGGTTAIMRYTLRLLTAQQFLRANKVIFALELIRRESPQSYGEEAFTSGLWVGGASSPNTFFQAKEAINKEQYSKLVITECPWCNQPFKPKNYCYTDRSFYFICTDKNCDFGQSDNNILPCNVVDEALYETPPSLLLATVDKFARLAWEERAGAFFGEKKNRPPELIIQDELHLISSALGSIVGLYESGIDTALIARGMHSKYIASTATIKHADKQVKSLFARDMQVFPPSGLRFDDSYFAKTVPLDQKPGRLYIGYLAPRLSRQNCMAPLAAALLAAPVHLFSNNEEFLDNWWTQVIYHGSLKGVNNSRVLYQNQIESQLTKAILSFMKLEIDKLQPEFLRHKSLKSINDFKRIADPEIKALVDQYLPVRDINIKSLTSNQSAEENAEIFTQLAQEKHEDQSIDVALATNMISVGLDVSRLALMIVNGQPLTTAEYIQASSRVGRGDVPGIVYVNFYKTQARSLSHYENFRSYHDAFYRYVEPSSLTPFTYQARKRALHAALIIAVRHSNIGLLKNAGAEQFDAKSADVELISHQFKLRCAAAIETDQEKQATDQNIDDLVAEWQQRIDYSDAQKRSFVYYENDKGSDNLICNFGENNGVWETLNSMRNVENVALVKLLPGVKAL